MDRSIKFGRSINKITRKQKRSVMKINNITIKKSRDIKQPHFIKTNPRSGYTQILMHLCQQWAIIDHNLYVIICAN